MTTEFQAAPAPVPASQAHFVPAPRPTSVLAILALVFGFVVPLVGAILGIVALVKLRSRQQGGKGLAIAGVVVGVIGTIAWAIVIASTVLVAAVVADTTGESAASDLVADLADDLGVHLSVGECTGDVPSGEVTSVTTIDCAQPHAYEVYSTFALAGEPGTAFPGETQVNTDAEAGCLAAFDGFVGLPNDESQYLVTFMTPTQKNWNAGDDREVSCLLADASGQMTGSAQGTAR